VEQDVVDDFSLYFGTIVVMDLAPHSWQRTLRHTERQKLIQREGGREGRREGGRAGGKARERESQRQKDVGWVVQH
jgi:hypothetical protein